MSTRMSCPPPSRPIWARRVPGRSTSMADAKPCHKHVMMAGRVYRTVSDRCWDVAKRVADMTAIGLWRAGHFANAGAIVLLDGARSGGKPSATSTIRWPEMVMHSGGRLVGPRCSSVTGHRPGHHRTASAEGTNLGFAGHRDRQQHQRQADRVSRLRWDSSPKSKARHGGVRPTPAAGRHGPPRRPRHQLQQVLAYPTDVGLAAASVITSNLLLRHPRLRMAISHGGGHARRRCCRGFREGHREFPVLQEEHPGIPTLQARRLYYDALVYDDPTLLHLIAKFGATQIMLGTGLTRSHFTIAHRQRAPHRRSPTRRRAISSFMPMQDVSSALRSRLPQ